MKQFFLAAIVVCIFASFWAPYSSSEAAECGKDVSPLIFSKDISNVLFVVSGNLDPDEAKALDISSIKSDIQSSLRDAGIQCELTETRETITGDRFLKIHIYGILLERRVYFCSVAVIQRRQQQEEDCTVREYSDVTSQIGNIRSQVRALMSDLLEYVH